MDVGHTILKNLTKTTTKTNKKTHRPKNKSTKNQQKTSKQNKTKKQKNNHTHLNKPIYCLARIDVKPTAYQTDTIPLSATSPHVFI